MLLPQLNAQRVRLRPLVRADIPALVTQANDRTIARLMPPIAYPYSSDHARRWVNKAQRLARQDREAHFAVERIDRAGLIGVVGIKNLNLQSRNGELEYWAGRRYRGKGYTSEALTLLLTYAFQDLRLHRVYAVILSSNVPSVRLAERCGLVREGTWREAYRARKGWLDVYAYGMLASEFDARAMPIVR